MAALLCDVVVRRRCAHAHVIHAASQFYHDKKVAWVSISMHTCDPVPIVMGLLLAALRAAGASLLIFLVFKKILSPFRKRAAAKRSKEGRFPG